MSGSLCWAYLQLNHWILDPGERHLCPAVSCFLFFTEEETEAQVARQLGQGPEAGMRGAGAWVLVCVAADSGLGCVYAPLSWQ